MRKYGILGAALAVLVSGTVAWSQLSVPAPSWTYAITSLGTGVATALGINVGSAGAPVVNGGALGTPSSGTATNLTNIPVANATGVLPAANGGAGTINGALKGNGSGTVSQAACADLSNGATGCSTTYTASTWTPTFNGSSTAGTGQTYNVQVGSHEIVGRQVTVRFQLHLAGAGTAAGNVLIGGLPVASSNTAGDDGMCLIAYYVMNGTSPPGLGLAGLIDPNTSSIRIIANGATASADLTVTQAGAAFRAFGTCSYHT